MATRSKDDLHLDLKDAYEKACSEYAIKYPHSPQPFMTCAIRTDLEQNLLYMQGRTAKGAIVTNAQGGQSPHNFKPSLAFDIAFITLDKKLDWDKKLFRAFADIIKTVSDKVVCGIEFRTIPDAPHFELAGWKELSKQSTPA